MEGIKQEIKTEHDHWMREWFSQGIGDASNSKCKIEDQTDNDFVKRDCWMREWSSQDKRDVPDSKFKVEEETDNDFVESEDEFVESGATDVEMKVETTAEHEDPEASEQDDMPDGNRGKQGLQVLSDKVGSLCKFQCPTCKENFMALTSLKDHFGKSSDCTPGTIAQGLVSATYHKCRFCSKKILNDTGILSTHVRYRHRVKNLDEYCRTFGLDRVKMKPKSIHDSLVKSLYKEEAGFVDFVGSLCKFQCLSCPKTFSTYRNLRDHEKTTLHSHGSLKDKIIEFKWHRCRLCDEPVLCDPLFLKDHAKNWHNVGLTSYVEAFKLDNNNLFKQSQDETKNLFQNAEITVHVGNLCTYKCPKCKDGKVFHSMHELKTHLLKESHGSKRYFPRFVIQTYIQKLVGHKCHLCDQTVICDQMFLTSHFGSKHKSKTFEEYVKHFGLQQYGTQKQLGQTVRDKIEKEASVSETLGNKCVFQCPFCGQKTNSWTQMCEHLRKDENVSATRHILEKCIVKCVSYQCKLCRRKLLCDGRMFTLHLDQYHKGMNRQKYENHFDPKPLISSATTSADIGNFCEYTCGKCNAVMKSWLKMKEHLIKLGHGDITFGTRDKLMTKHVLHECRLCHKSIINDWSLSQRHMTRNHKMQLQEYAEKFGVECKKNVRMQDQYNEERTNFIKEIPSYPVQESVVLPKGIIPKGRLSKHIGNLCNYKCTLCTPETRMSSWATVQYHLHKNHCKARALSFDHKFVVEARYHECLICAKIVLCDNAALTPHLRRHRMRIQDYTKLVEQNGGALLTHFTGKRLMRSNKGKDKISLRPCSVQLQRLRIPQENSG